VAPKILIASNPALRALPIPTVATGPPPGICPIENARNCAANPRGPDCIRMVEARLCNPEGDGCAPVPYSTLVPISAFPPGTFNFPSFATVAPAGSLGRNPNTPSVCR